MIVAIIILSILFVGAVLFIFWLLKVLKNTYQITDTLVEMAAGKTPIKFKEAYNGKYYPGTVIAQVQYNCKNEGKIVDFSMYETHKIIGFTLFVKESLEEYYGFAIDLLEESEELVKELKKPIILKNVLVYEVKEGDWLWKSAE